VRYESSETEEEFAHLRDECPLVILDDLGRERITDWVAERLYVLVESRYGRRLPTCASSNSTLDQLAAAGYDALVSRLTETCDLVRLSASDYRPEKGGHSGR
jgi:DNA replication protein DnaC